MSQQIGMTVALLETATTTKDVLEIPQVRNNWISTYERVYGSQDGAQRFEAEKIMFLQTVGASKALAQCSKPSLYAAFTELAISGLTLRDGLAYIIPYGSTASFMPGWKGRLEQISEMPDVIFVHEPIVVRDGDEFEHEQGENPKVIKHKPQLNSNAQIVMVYLVVEFKHGTKVYFMDRNEVINIRDRYSKTYKSYINDCRQADQQVGNTFKKTISGRNGSFEVDVEPPMWVSSEAQAFKKTIVKRVYGVLPKTKKLKDLDEMINARGGVEMEIEPEDDFKKYTTVMDDQGNNANASQNQQDNASQSQQTNQSAQADNSQGGAAYQGF